MYDKKQEAQFRKVCANWLTKIAKVSIQAVRTYMYVHICVHVYACTCICIPAACQCKAVL